MVVNVYGRVIRLNSQGIGICPHCEKEFRIKISANKAVCQEVGEFYFYANYGILDTISLQNCNKIVTFCCYD